MCIRDRVVFYYLAEKRVDFRELVKALAQRYKTRIEMRQIGVRDEAKMLADYGDCGKPVCCNTHLKTMPPVSMKMAKLQKATLDPNKISGRCGRLKCCLRYEFDTYEEYRRELPRVGSTVVTRDGQGRVLAQEILSKKVVVAFEDKRRAIVALADIVSVISKSGGGNQGGAGDSQQGNTPPAGQDQKNAAEADTPQASASSVESDDKIAEPAEETDAGENVPEESPGATGGENGDN